MTTLFSTTSPQIPISEIFGPRFKDFYICAKLRNKTNLRTLSSNMAILFSNFSPKIRKHFLVTNLRAFIFCPKLCNKANSRALISNMTMVFQNCCPKHPNKAFGSKLRNSNFSLKLCNQTNWRALITNMTIVFRYSSRKTQVELFWSQVYFFFVLDETLQFHKFGAD